MRSLTGREVVRLLEAHGWTVRRIHGSHHVLAKEGRRERISVPVHGRRTLKAGLLKWILRTAEIPESEL